jgi:Protein of unknown function (DUF3618)
MTTSESKATGTSAADIERTRAEIGETMQALVAKADVKGRAQQKVGEVRNRLADRTGSTNMAPMARRSGAALVALTTVVVAAWMWRRRRMRNRSAWHRATHRTMTRTRAMGTRAGAQVGSARARMHARRATHRVRG